MSTSQPQPGAGAVMTQSLPDLPEEGAQQPKAEQPDSLHPVAVSGSVRGDGALALPGVAAKTRTYHADGSAPIAGQIFVFGSNLSGIHGGGAARAAHQLYGAAWGVAEGRTGNSYAIPTVKAQIAGPLSLDDIRAAVERFLHHAATHPEDSFLVTRVGCVLAGHKDADIAPMFKDASLNCSLPDTWRQLIE